MFGGQPVMLDQFIVLSGPPVAVVDAHHHHLVQGGGILNSTFKNNAGDDVAKHCFLLLGYGENTPAASNRLEDSFPVQRFERVQVDHDRFQVLPFLEDDRRTEGLAYL